MPRLSVWSLGLSCLWGGVVAAAPAPPVRGAATAPAAPIAAAPPRAAAPPVGAATVLTAVGPEDPGEAAQRHFELGRELVDAGKLSEGVRELLAAHAASAEPPAETDFYLGLAYDSLRRTDPAILAYLRYLARSPGSLNARSVRERLALLESRRGEGSPLLPEAEAAPRVLPERKGYIPPLRVTDAPARAPAAGKQRAAERPRG